MPDFVCVIFKRATSSHPLAGPRPQHAGWRDVLERQATAGRDLLRADELLQRRHGRVHDVDRVVRAERLGQHVVDAGALEHGTHRTTGDDAGTGTGRLEQHHAGRLLALHRVRDGRGDPRDLEEVLLGLLDALGDRGRNLLGLAVADTDRAVAVADDDQRREAEPASALDDLGDAVDGDDALEVGAALGVAAAASTAVATVSAVAAVVTGTAGAASPLRCGHRDISSVALVLGLLLTLRTPARLRGRPRRTPRSDRCRRSR